MNVRRSLIQVRSAATGVELARGQHDLPILAVDHVAVVVDRDEVVVRADFLDLPERVEQRLVVPERHVVERGGVSRDVGARQRRIARELALFDVVEAEGRTRRRDGVRDERRFAHLLVRRDYKRCTAELPVAADEHGQ